MLNISYPFSFPYSIKFMNIKSITPLGVFLLNLIKSTEKLSSSYIYIILAKAFISPSLSFKIAIGALFK